MNGEVLIVDEHTGRMLAGRRYNEGMHQAIEAKEGVEIKNENQTLATITLQNYFRLYDKLSGMTGTAMTEAAEFYQIYKLGVVPIPTNKPMIRADQADLVYRTEDAKFKAVVDDIVERHEKGQPVLVGTVSVEKSEYLSEQLRRARGPPRGAQRQAPRARGRHRRRGRPQGRRHRRHEHGRPRHRHHARRQPRVPGGRRPAGARLDPHDTPEEYEAAWDEALATAEAAVAAEHDEVTELGGLYVLGTERHESRRIDNQLRGRSGRQGDPGESRFYLSLEDHLMRLFNAAPRRPRHDHRSSSRTTCRSSRRWSPLDPVRAGPGRGAELRDPQERPQVRRGPQPPAHRHLRRAPPRPRGRGPARAAPLLHQRRSRATSTPRPPRASPRTGTSSGCGPRSSALYPVSVTPEEVEEAAGGRGSLTNVLVEELNDAHHAYDQREEALGAEVMREVERVVLSVLDRKWREHLYEMDYLQEGIGLRAMAQRDPLVEYQREGYALWPTMMEAIKEESVGLLFNVEVQVDQPTEAPTVEPVHVSQMLGAMAGAPAGDGRRASRRRDAGRRRGGVRPRPVGAPPRRPVPAARSRCPGSAWAARVPGRCTTPPPARPVGSTSVTRRRSAASVASPTSSSPTPRRTPRARAGPARSSRCATAAADPADRPRRALPDDLESPPGPVGGSLHGRRSRRSRGPRLLAGVVTEVPVASGEPRRRPRPRGPA